MKDLLWHTDNLNEEVLTIPNFLTIEECKQISNFLFEHEEEILKLTEPNNKQESISYFELIKSVSNYGQQGPPNSYRSGLLKKSWIYNILQYKEIGNLLLPKLKKTLFDDGILDKFFIKNEDLYIRGWGNILRYGEDIPKHKHASQGIYSLKDRNSYFLCINIFIDGPTFIGTNFQHDSHSSPVKYENNIGDITFFNSFKIHSVDKNFNNTPRLSLAFDVINNPSFIGDINKSLWEKINA